MLIAAHHIFFGGKKTPTAKSYKGIIAHLWDGIENGGYGVHNASASSWKDLVGGYDAAKSGSPTFSDNAGVTNGANNTFYATLPNSSRFIQAAKSSPVTIEICLSTSSAWGNACPFSIEDSNGSSSVYRMLQFFMRTDTGIHTYRPAPYNKNGTAFCGDTGNMASPNGTIACIMWYESSKAYVRVFRDGVEYTGGNSNLAIFNPADIDTFGVPDWYVRIGKTHNNSMSANFHRVTLHAGAVSATDLAYNYTIDKARFGLP